MQVTESDLPMNDPQEDKAFEEATRDLKTLQLVTEVTEEIEEDEPMSQIATKTDVAQISFLGIPLMSPTQATTYAGGHIGPPTAGPSHSTLSTGGMPSGPSQVIQTASGMVGSRGQTGGTASQSTGVSSGQASVPSTGAPPIGTSAPQGMQPSRGSGSGEGGGGGGGAPGLPAPPPGGPAAAQAALATGPLPAANGALRGHPPEIFNGQQKNTQKFMKEFTLWKMCNLQNEAMTNPFQRIALALSYIKGPRVDDWVAKTSDNTIRKVFGDPQAIPPIAPIYADNDENLWNEFVNNFTQAFADTAMAEQAYTDLSKLEMKGDEINKYIATFEHLLARAGWDRTAHGSIEMFKQGLQKGIHAGILQKDPLPIGIDQWQAAA